MRYTLLALFVTAAVALADPPAIDIPAEVRPAGQYVTLLPKTDATAVSYVGLDGVEPIPSVVLKDARMFLLDTRGLGAGRYRFAAVAAKGGEQSRTDFTVVVGTPPPVPPGPTPPGPNPPVPPTPTDVPFAGTTGLRVLIVYETGDLPKMPQDQQAILFAQANRDFLNSKCVVGPDGKTHEWNMWDKDVQLANVPQVWKDAMRRALSKSADYGTQTDYYRKNLAYQSGQTTVPPGAPPLPWVAIGNGTAGFEGPLQKTTAEFQAAVTKVQP